MQFQNFALFILFRIELSFAEEVTADRSSESGPPVRSHVTVERTHASRVTLHDVILRVVTDHMIFRGQRFIKIRKRVRQLHAKRKE